jgi:hypothetical protein
MRFYPKIKIGVPKWENLSVAQQTFTEALYKRLAREHLVVIKGLSEMDLPSRFDQVKDCDGVIVLCFAMWSAERISPGKQKERAIFASDFVRIYTTLALAGRCPLLVLVEKSVTLRGELRPHFVPKPVKLPKDLDPSCLTMGVPGHHFNIWLQRVRGRKHVFLGYSSLASATAAKIRLFLKRMGVSVIDWTDFQRGRSIYEQLEEAAEQTTCGIFLFTKDAPNIDRRLRTPGDNVLFEAGFFSAAKGKARTLIIVEHGVQIPDDLGGDIYIPLANRDDTSFVCKELRKNLISILGSSE